MAQNKVDEILRERDALAAQIRSLQDQLAGLDRAVAILRREDSGATPKAAARAPKAVARAPKPLVKDAKPPAPRRTKRAGGPRPRNQALVLELLGEAGDGGLSVTDVLAAGASRGTPMARASISSLLSRLKRQGQVESRDGRYILIDRG